MAQSAKKRLKHGDYTVAIVCALEVEMSAVRYMLDEEHERLPGGEGESNRYILGAMSGHNVAIGYLPHGSQGIGAAATVATDMKRTFLAVKLRLLVGIGGGVPGPAHDVRLGDVVVSMPDGQHGGVVQYDLGKDTILGFQRKGFLEAPPTNWRNAVVDMKSEQRVNKSLVLAFVSAMIQRYPSLSTYQPPDHDNDVLFQPQYIHVPDQLTCENCDRTESIRRAARHSNDPVIHYGLIASGNRVMKDAVKRNQVSRDAGGVLCFEMEAAGLMNDFHCIVIRGIADYADSHKNDDWHAYAAATAAGCAKELLGYMDATVDRRQTTYHFVPNQRVKEFFGREEELKNIQLAFPTEVTIERPRIVILHAMGGQGKSQLALEYCRLSSDIYDGIFWINAYSIATTIRSYVNIADELKLAAAPDVKDDAKVRLVLHMLSGLERRWLVVFDNCDNPATFQQIREFVPVRGFGDIIFTSRHEGLQRFGTTIEIPALSTPAAVRLLLRAYRDVKLDDYIPIASRIVNRLGGLALAIDQAASYIENYQLPIHRLEDFLRKYETERTKILASTPIYSWEYGSTWMEKPDFKDAVSAFTTWELSFHHFCKAQAQQQQDLVHFLTTSAHLAPTLVDEKIFRWHWQRSDSPPEWLKLFVSRPEHDVDEDVYMYHNNEGDSHTITPDPVNSSRLQHYTTWSHDNFWQVISQAKAFSLLQHVNHDFEEDESSFSFHPLIRDWLQLRQRNRELRRGFSNSCISMLETSIRTIEIQGALSGFRASLLLHLDASVRADGELSREGRRMGQELTSTQHAHHFANFYRSHGRSSSAFELCRRARETLQHEYGAEHPETLPAINLEAMILVKMEQFKEAERLFRAVTDAYQRMSEVESKHFLTGLNNLAGVMSEQGEYAEAERLQREVTSSRSRILGPDHWQVLQSKGNLANMLKNQGKYEEADSLLRKTLEVQFQVLGIKHRETIRSIYLLAASFAGQGRYEEAEHLYREVSELRNQVLGPEHPDTLWSRYGLATTLAYQGKYKEAERLHREVLELRSRVLGPEHTDTLESEYCSARALLDQGSLDNSMLEDTEALIHSLLELQISKLGAEDRATMAKKRLYIWRFDLEGAVEEANRLHRELLESQIRVLGAEDPDTLSSKQYLSFRLIQQGKYEEAEEVDREALEAYVQMPGMSHLESTGVREYLARRALKSGKT